MRSPTTPIVLTALLLAALPAGATAQQEDDQAFLRVPVPEKGEDRIHRLRTQVRHTTVIVLPADENILDFVVGDSEYWHLAGAAFAARLGAAWSGGSLMTVVTEGVNVFFSSLVALMMGVPLVLGLVALFCLTYAQVIWAQVALAIVILLGPVFIPWLLFEPLAFLFWGWFRTLMVYTLYGVVAGAILRVFMGVGMGYVTTYTGALMGTGSSDPAELGLWVVVLLPLVVSGLMAGMKVGELAAMLVSGSGSVGSGMMALVVRGGGRLTAASNPARPPVPGG